MTKHPSAEGWRSSFAGHSLATDGCRVSCSATVAWPTDGRSGGPSRRWELPSLSLVGARSGRTRIWSGSSGALGGSARTASSRWGRGTCGGRCGGRSGAPTVTGVIGHCLASRQSVDEIGLVIANRVLGGLRHRHSRAGRRSRHAGDRGWGEAERPSGSSAHRNATRVAVNGGGRRVRAVHALAELDSAVDPPTRLRGNWDRKERWGPAPRGDSVRCTAPHRSHRGVDDGIGR